MQLNDALEQALKDFIETESKSKTPTGLANTFKAEAIGEIFKFLARQDWEEVAKQNREARKDDA